MEAIFEDRTSAIIPHFICTLMDGRRGEGKNKERAHENALAQKREYLEIVFEIDCDEVSAYVIRETVSRLERLWFIFPHIYGGAELEYCDTNDGVEKLWAMENSHSYGTSRLINGLPTADETTGLSMMMWERKVGSQQWKKMIPKYWGEYRYSLGSEF